MNFSLIVAAEDKLRQRFPARFCFSRPIQFSSSPIQSKLSLILHKATPSDEYYGLLQNKVDWAWVHEEESHILFYFSTPPPRFSSPPEIPFLPLHKNFGMHFPKKNPLEIIFELEKFQKKLVLIFIVYLY
jgi:hypothetical protein